ncbi:hypothetical protein Ct61P_13247 [Colletotrichum tofieldiae]|nr:hypothetical protein Ct61P_13247 [Colletotrichum tofieldiae]
MNAKMETIPDPRDLPPDPRLPGHQPQYSRDNIVASLESFYQSLPHVDPLWHLPYIDGSPFWITPETFPINYRTAVALVPAIGVYKPKWVHALSHDLQSFECLPPWVFQLSMSVNRDGDIWLLDTMDGTVTKYIITGATYPEPVGRYKEGDPRMWREKLCDDVTLPLESWLEGMLEMFKKFLHFGIPRHSDPGVLWPDQKWSIEIEEIKKILVRNGWPENYRGEECRKELAEWLTQADI